MLRLNPTSISLSDKDIQDHLQQIDLYHELLKQGFKKKQIMQYYAEHKAQVATRHAPFELPPTPSTVQMMQTPYKAKAEEQDYNDECPQASPASPGSPPHAVNIVPRKTSLLRFARTASSDSPDHHSTETDDSQLDPEFVTSPRTQAAKFKRRTSTTSFEISEEDGRTEEEGDSSCISEIDEGVSQLNLSSSPNASKTEVLSPFATGELFSPGTRRKSPVSSPLRPDAEEFTPRLLPPPFSSSRRVSNPEHLPSSPPVPGTSDTQETASSTLTTLVNAGLASILPSERLIPSSQTNAPSHYSNVMDTVHVFDTQGLNARPTTPPRSSVAILQSEPRRRPQHNLDGSLPFVIYNDNAPQDTQPQTPADISRRPPLTDRDVRYTAPPGRIRTMTRSHFNQLSTVHEPGEQSPTVRAIGIRERRAREIRRGVRMAEVRVQQERAEENVRQQQEETEDNTIGIAARIERALRQNGLETDRTGEENFAEGLNEATGNGGAGGARRAFADFMGAIEGERAGNADEQAGLPERAGRN